MNNTLPLQRRRFLKQITGIAALAPIANNTMSNHFGLNDSEGKGFTFLFQGDSITDGNRSRNNDWNHVMGHGYAYLIASRLWYNFPEKEFHFLNRGISGNKVVDLVSRWQNDTINLEPQVLSILIGINDTSALLNGDVNFSSTKYEEGYRALLQQTKERLPNVQFVLCEPFVLPVGKVKDRWEEYLKETEKQREIVSRLSSEFDAVLVKFQDAFNRALSKAHAEYWIWDGIHPMPAGHELMAREWISAVSKKLKFIKS